MDRVFAAAQPGGVFSTPVTLGAYTVITASEIVAAGGFGSGQGSGSQESVVAAGDPAAPRASGQGGGSGGGGFSAGRPVAAIVIGPDGVKIEPILDATKFALAVIATVGSLALLLGRMASKR